MSAPSEEPRLYRNVSSRYVNAEFRKLADQAEMVDKLTEFVAALKKIQRLLQTYPQFGEPLIDLVHERGQICHLSVPPLVVRYAIFEEQRLVLLTTRPELLPRGKA